MGVISLQKLGSVCEIFQIWFATYYSKAGNALPSKRSFAASFTFASAKRLIKNGSQVAEYILLTRCDVVHIRRVHMPASAD